MQCIHNFQNLFSIMNRLTMFVQVLNHSPQDPRYPVIHQTSLLQLRQGHSKLPIGFHCPAPQNWKLNHLLHVLFNQCCCRVVLQEEESIYDSSHNSCVQWWRASCLPPPILALRCQLLWGRCEKAARPSHGHVLLRQSQVSMQHVSKLHTS